MSAIGLAAAGAGLNTASNLVSGGLQQLFTRRNMKYQYKLNEKAADNAFRREIEAWNMQNAYNTPAAQMERYKQAGLNPHLIYGQSNTTSGLSGTAGHGASLGSAPRITFPDFIGLLSQAQDYENSKKLGRKIDADTALTEANTFASQTRSILNTLSYRRGEYDLGYKQRMEHLFKNVLEERLKLMRSATRMNTFTGSLREKELKDWNDIGLRPGDPAWMRILYNVFNNNRGILMPFLK